jgi:hypothetical protein
MFTNVLVDAYAAVSVETHRGRCGATSETALGTYLGLLMDSKTGLLMDSKTGVLKVWRSARPMASALGRGMAGGRGLCSLGNPSA